MLEELENLNVLLLLQAGLLRSWSRSWAVLGVRELLWTELTLGKTFVLFIHLFLVVDPCLNCFQKWLEVFWKWRLFSSKILENDSIFMLCHLRFYQQLKFIKRLDAILVAICRLGRGVSLRLGLRWLRVQWWVLLFFRVFYDKAEHGRKYVLLFLLWVCHLSWISPRVVVGLRDAAIELQTIAVGSLACWRIGFKCHLVQIFNQTQRIGESSGLLA